MTRMARSLTLHDGSSEELAQVLSTRPCMIDFYLQQLSVEGATALVPLLQSAQLDALSFSWYKHYPHSADGDVATTRPLVLDIFLGAIAQNESVRSLSLSQLAIWASSLGKVLAQTTLLEVLHIGCYCRLICHHSDGDFEGDFSPESAAQLIGTLGRIKTFSLQDDTGSSHDISTAIFHLAKHHAHLTELKVHLRGDQIQVESETASALGALISCTKTLKTLSLSYLLSPTAETLGPVLQGFLQGHNTCTKSLNLSLSVGRATYGVVLPTPGVDEQLAEFLRLLTVNTYPTSLGLRRWCSSVAPILHALGDNQSITQLMVKFDIYEDHNAPNAMFYLLSRNTKIQQLALDYSSALTSRTLVDVWPFQLAQVLLCNSTLESLHVNKLQMSTDGLVEILLALQTNTTLQRLLVNGMVGGKSAAWEAIGNCLPAITKLNRLVLRWKWPDAPDGPGDLRTFSPGTGYEAQTAFRNGIFSDEAQKAFQNGIRQNHSLYQLAVNVNLCQMDCQIINFLLESEPIPFVFNGSTILTGTRPLGSLSIEA